MNTRPGGSGDVKLTADVADGATVAPGQDIAFRLTWDPEAWSGAELDMALACVQVKGGLDPDLSGEEQPTANDGAFEYRLHVPDNIKPDCDICVQGFLAGIGADGGQQQVGSNRPVLHVGPARRRRRRQPPATAPPTTADHPTTRPGAGRGRRPRSPGSNVTRPAPAPLGRTSHRLASCPAPDPRRPGRAAAAAAHAGPGRPGA